MAAHLGEVAGLISLVQLRTGLGVEGLGRARQRAAGGGRRDLRAVNPLILDGIGHQRVGAPLGIEVQVAVNRHLEVKGFLFAAVADVEPVDELVRIAGRRRVRSGDDAAVCNSFSVVKKFSFLRAAGFHQLPCQISLDRVRFLRPLGIEDNIGRGHRHRAKVNLRSVNTADGRIPAVKYIDVRLKRRRVLWVKFVLTQRCFKLHGFIRSADKTIVVVKAETITIAGVIEIVVPLHSYLPVLRKVRIGVTLRKSGDRMELFSVCQACAATIGEVDHLILVVVFPVIRCIARRAVQCFNVVINFRARFRAFGTKRYVFTRHGVYTAEVTLFIHFAVGFRPFRNFPPNRIISLFNWEIAVDIRAIFGGDGF